MCSEPIFSINKFVYKICDCDYNIHKECLNSWININSKCLICHQFVTKKSCKNALILCCKKKYVLCITNFLIDVLERFFCNVLWNNFIFETSKYLLS